MNTENLYRIGRVTVDSSFHTQSADEAFFSYFGNDVTYSIKRTIYPDDAEKIEEFMDLLLKNKEIKTDDFDGYFMLPRLTRGWNKYLLIGIIKTFFREKYDIQNTTNFYDTTDFIIRRIN